MQTKAKRPNRLVPRSHSFQAQVSWSQSNQDRGLQWELPTTGNVLMNSRAVVADSRLIKCDRFSYQQVIRILHHRMHQEVHDFGKRARRTNRRKPPSHIYPKRVQPVRRIHPSLGPRPASHPKSGGGLLNLRKPRYYPRLLHRSTSKEGTPVLTLLRPKFKLNLTLFQAFPSCSRKTRVFGPVVPVRPKA